MRLLAAIALLALPLSARAQCVAVPGGPGNTVLSCPGGTSLLHTDPTGTVTGLVNGQPFVGRNPAPGVVTGTLGGQPYSVLGGRAPEPPKLFEPPPPNGQFGLPSTPAPQIAAPPPVYAPPAP